MTIFFKTDSFGKITSRMDLFSPPDELINGFILDDRCEERHTHYINGDFLVQPVQPSPSHEWSDDLFSWVLNLDMAKQSAKNMITEARNAEEKAGFVAYGKLIDSDALSISRINTAAQSAQAIGESFVIDWTCADNSVITLDYAQMVCMPVLMAQAGNLLHEKARALKAQIDAATTPEEINAVQW